MSPPEKRKEESPVPPVAGERTWTLFACPECGDVEHDPGRDPERAPGCQNYEHHVTGLYPYMQPVPVVELSRLRAAEEERDAFKAEVETLNRWLEEERGPWIEEVKSQMVPALRSLEVERDSLSAQLGEAREALEFYADRNKWTQPTGYGSRIFDDEGEATTDCGKVARQFLARFPATEGK